MTMTIHHTMGVYPNGDRTHNGVITANLADHTQYNLDMRPGRAFFVDGVCRYPASLTPETVAAIEAELKAAPKVMTRDTAPYR